MGQVPAMEQQTEYVVNTMSGPPPEATQNRTHAVPEYKLKFLTPLGIEPGPQGWIAGALKTTPRQRNYC